MKYYNYHCHNMYGNPISMDVIVSMEDYCKRAIELGHDAFFTTCHGLQGDIFQATTLAHQYGLKMIVGAELYYVKDRLAVDEEGKKDRSNKHIIIIALNHDGIRDLNRIITESFETGMYYRPRIDEELLFSLNPNNVMITTACVAGLWNEEELIIKMKDYFKSNFFLEVQDHNEDIQKEVNRKVLQLSQKYHIRIIHANDSHYIYPEDAKYRDLFLKAKGIIYEQEANFILDYPDYDTIVKRYEAQGILNKNQIQEALESTMIFENINCDDYINDEIKLPSVAENPNEELKKVITASWNEDKERIPKEKRKEYLEAIRYEFDIIEKTNMANYFLIDYNIAKIAKEKYGGVLTNTGRGSAPSFYITRLLHLTNIDRLESPITLFPTRFMSIERILGARSLPDIDLNTADAEPFIQASKDLLGENNCGWMISWKPLQESSGFRLYCKALDIDYDTVNEIAKDLDKYRDDPKWAPIIEESKRFIGVVEGVSESPCSMLLYSKDVRSEIGMIKTPNGKICCMLDGYNCDKYKYLKNDYLTVTVWAIIRDVCKLANIQIPSINELDKLLDDKTFDVYKKGLTCSINQADSDYATNLVMKYKPKSLAEMSSFVAIIRPGCASLLDDFIERKSYTTGVQALDNILEDSEHRLIYQESIMKYLIWLGISEPQSYDVIKKIAKKKFKEPELKALKEQLLEGWQKQVGEEKGFEETWQVVEDAAKYSFNASHSLSYAYDSLYGAYLKSHYPLEYYTVALNYYSNDATRTGKLTSELKSYGITLEKPKFRYSIDEYFMDKENNKIYKGTGAIKFLNKECSLYLYSLKDKRYDSFIDLLEEVTNAKDENNKAYVNTRQLDILIKLQYFQEFGNNKKLSIIYDYFKNLYGRKLIAKDKLRDFNIPDYALKLEGILETEKQYKFDNMCNILKLIEKNIPNESFDISEQVSFEMDALGYISMTYDVKKNICFVIDVDTKYTPRLTLYCLNNGKSVICKVNKNTFKNNPINKNDIIKAIKFEEKYKQTLVDGNWKRSDTKEWWLVAYNKTTIEGEINNEN
ncbi:MAG: PHP domain-containing protein [Bacilli bacterium]|nr:PHP domain-containing protein [bacterium]MBR2891017.1 PHP domain-containing protein [Bacilli bacterium]MBR4003998.1 PHP domain-containing protein [Clostridia bacterium]